MSCTLDDAAGNGHSSTMSLGPVLQCSGQSSIPVLDDDPFIHPSLDGDEPSLRLTKPSNASSDGQGRPAYTTSTFKLSECPPYAALSYSWGASYTEPFEHEEGDKIWVIEGARVPSVLRSNPHGTYGLQREC